MKTVGKRLLTLALCLLLMAGFSVTAAAAGGESAIILEKTEGTVAITDGTGMTVSLADGAGLHSGYTVSTAAASYAWLSLDGTTTVKLDGLSRARVTVSGKRLLVRLDAGRLYFHTSQPLGADESLEIATTHMVMSTGGATGIVSVVSGDKAVAVSVIPNDFMFMPGWQPEDPSDSGMLPEDPLDSGVTPPEDPWDSGMLPEETQDSGMPSTPQGSSEEDSEANAVGESCFVILEGTATVGNYNAVESAVPVSEGYWMVAGDNSTELASTPVNASQILTGMPFAGVEVLENQSLTANMAEAGLLDTGDMQELSQAVQSQLIASQNQQLELEAQLIPATAGQPAQIAPNQFFSPQDPEAPAISTIPPIISGGGNTAVPHKVTLNCYVENETESESNWKVFGTYSFTDAAMVPQPWLIPIVENATSDGYWTADKAAAESWYENRNNEETPPAEFALSKTVTTDLSLYWVPDGWKGE